MQERFGSMRGRFANLWRRASATFSTAGLAILVSGMGTAHAQSSWVFDNEIPCATAPVYGVPFDRCWISNIRTFRIGTVQSWRLTYSDAKSEVAIGFYRLVEAHGVGGLSPVSSSNAVDWLRTADPLRNVTAGAGGWAYSASRAGDHYVTFSRARQQCIGFIRNGSGTPRQLYWILSAVFCRESATPLPMSEAEFIADAVRVRE